MARPAHTARARAQRRRRRRLALAAGAAAVIVAGGGVAWAMNTKSGPSYRLATVTAATVQQTVTSVGTISSANQVSVAFPVAGQVKSVAVGLGTKVKAGSTVATLDTTALEQQVQSAQATVAAARQALANDQQSQTSGTSASSASSTSSRSATSDSAGVTTDDATVTPLAAAPSAPPARSTSGAGAAAHPSATSLTSVIAAVTAKQRAVIADQHKIDLDTDVARADKAVVAENTACRAILDDTPSAPSTPTATATPTPTKSPSPTGSPTAASTPSSAPGQDLQTCQDAIALVQSAQQKVQSDEDSITADETALDKAVSALLAALQANGTGSGSGSAGSGGTQSRGSTAGGTSGSGTATRSGGTSASGAGRTSSTLVTAAQLAADQKQIDAATANLAVATQNLAQAELTTPISGTVAAVSMVAGDSVSAASSSETITVIGSGQKQLATTVGIADIDLVKAGETAQVTVNGVSTPLPGTVRLIGVLNTSGTSGTTATYPVTVVLDPTALNLYDGSGASVAIDVGTATQALTVPTSAIHKLGALATVTLDKGGTLSTVRVSLGVEGSDRTQITSGLKAGQRVVLATVSAPVPTNSAGNGRGFGGGGLPAGRAVGGLGAGGR